jgi:hypothetical protein
MRERLPVGLDPEEEAGVLKGIAEIAAGRGIPVHTVSRKLRRLVLLDHR